MKITKTYIQNLVKEELNRVLNEANFSKKQAGKNIQFALSLLSDSPEKQEAEKQLIRFYATNEDPKEIAEYAIEMLEPLKGQVRGENEETFLDYINQFKKGLGMN